MAPQSSSYVNEAHVQEVLASSPHWVPGVPERSLSVRELYTSTEPLGRADFSALCRSQNRRHTSVSKVDLGTTAGNPLAVPYVVTSDELASAPAVRG
jgi:hypothetical protein